MPSTVAIAAVDPKGVMGKNGQLPWHYPEDLQHFDHSTKGQVIIMGYTTFVSLPSHILQGRTCFVFTNSHSIRESNITSVKNLDELKRQSDGLNKTHFVIGGSAIFTLFFREQMIDEAWMTHINKCYEGDTYFPMHFLMGWKKRKVVQKKDFSIVYYIPV